MPDSQEHIFQLWQKEQENLLPLRSTNPELFRRAVQAESAEILKLIGIELPYKDVPSGYLKFHPLDFIVEEIEKDGNVITADFEGISYPSEIEKGKTVYADLVKVGLSTLDAVRDLARQLNLTETQIAYAGIKDAIALTSQRISIRGAGPETFSNFQTANYFLKNISVGKGVVEKGGLAGNRFTIFIRTGEDVNVEELSARLQDIADHGFWNFYWMQRFGNRLLGHKLGGSILRGNYREAVRSYLLDMGPNELPYFRQARENLSKSFGNWKAMKKAIEMLPYSMRNEYLLLCHLETNGKDYIGALQQIPEQVTMWVQAYTSYLANRMLSGYAGGSAGHPAKLPLPLSLDEAEHAIYEEYLEEERIPKNYKQFLRPFSQHIRLASRAIDVKIFPKIHAIKLLPEGLLISFDLPKGTYATTFLSHLFTLTGGQPVPAWVKRTLYDNKKILGMGSSERAYEHLKDFIVEKNLIEGE